MELTTWILIGGTVGLLLAFLVYRIATIEPRLRQRRRPIIVDPSSRYRVTSSRYRDEVEMAWANETLSEAERRRLDQLETELGLGRERAKEIERDIMGGTREELVSPDDYEREYLPADEQWMGLVEECVGVVKDLDRNMAAFDPARQELADHVILSLAEGLERTGVDLIVDDEVFDSRRHELAEATSRTASGEAIVETVSPGFAVGRRILRKVQVRVEDSPPAEEPAENREWEEEERLRRQAENRERASEDEAPLEPTTATREQAGPQLNVEGHVRLIMQVLITIVGLVICVMIVFDGCYGWLGWCKDPAGEAAKNWASGIVGTVVGFWLIKS